MSKAKHTPGPWQTSGEDLRGVYADNGAALVATVHTASLPEAGRADRLDVTAANARLIAAAPDLRAALEMVNHCTVVKDGINGPQMWLTHQSVIDAVKAVLAKTNGA